MKHSFTETIFEMLTKHFGEEAEAIFNNSELLKYINQKTVSAHKGSKARGSFGNLYAIYVLVEDYVKKGFHENGDYVLFYRPSCSYRLDLSYSTVAFDQMNDTL